MSPKRLIDLLRRPARENLLGRIAVGRLPSDGSDTDARGQQQASEAAYRRPVKQWSVARDGILSCSNLESCFSARAISSFARAICSCACASSSSARAPRTWRGSVCFGFSVVSVVSISAPYPVQYHPLEGGRRSYAISTTFCHTPARFDQSKARRWKI